jgi:hypothetical protein
MLSHRFGATGGILSYTTILGAVPYGVTVHAPLQIAGWDTANFRSA